MSAEPYRSTREVIVGGVEESLGLDQNSTDGPLRAARNESKDAECQDKQCRELLRDWERSEGRRGRGRGSLEEGSLPIALIMPHSSAVMIMGREG